MSETSAKKQQNQLSNYNITRVFGNKNIKDIITDKLKNK